MFLQHALSCHVGHRSLLFIPIDIKKLVANAVPENTKKCRKNMFSMPLKVKKVKSRLSDLVLRKLKLGHFIK